MSLLNFGSTLPAGTLSFLCKICGEACSVVAAELGREIPSCAHCGSTVRMRGMVHALSTALFFKSLAIPDFPERKDLLGKGMSDWEGYAKPLAKKLGYTNTFYHKPPRLYITQITQEDQASVDFLLSTDVFEHVNPPVSRAFENARAMLRGNGAFVFSVPYVLTGQTTEHFPNLFEYRIENRGAKKILVNKTREGRTEEFENLVFHGGEGETLETRVFSLPNLLNDLAHAGFADVKVMSEPCFEHGIFWPQPWSLPIIARPSVPSVVVSDWGPRSSFISAPANQNQSDCGAIWIKTELILDKPPMITVGDLKAQGVVCGKQLVTAFVPAEISRVAGKYPVVIESAGFAATLVGELLIHD
ncbi:MAG: hypothetical protein KGN31_01875 [Betaproteobacteria bacterium]|nr:hypothetical protein [Betaproteobacteria bacterium]